MDENIDMFKMLDKAKELKKILNSGENESTENISEKNDDLDISKIIQMMEIMKMFNNSESNKTEKEVHPEMKTTYEREDFFDDKILTPEIKGMKAIVPFLEYNKQKFAAIFIKVLEIQKIINYYDSEEVKFMLKEENSEMNPKIFGALRPYMDSEKKYLIDMIEKIFELKDIVNKYNNVNEL